MLIARWWQNGAFSRRPKTGPRRMIYLEQVWRVRWQTEDEPPKASNFSREEAARHWVEMLKRRAGGEWDGGDERC